MGGTRKLKLICTNPKMLSLDNGNFQGLFADHDNFLFDCDGVLWHGNALIAGASETLALLKQKGKKVFYVTNNSTSTRADYAVKCRKLGLPAEERDIVCTAHSAALYLQELLQPSATCRPKLYLIGNPAMLAELNSVGIDCIGVGPDHVPEDFSQSSWPNVQLEDDIKAVLVGFDKHISFLKMMKAASYLKDPNVFFVGTNTDQSFPTVSSRIAVPGTGCIVACVEMAAHRSAVIVGKPETLMVDSLRHEFQLDCSRSVFIGDRLNTDILLARKCGMTGILVLSGVSTLAEARQYHENPSSSQDDKNLVPHFYMNDVQVLHSLLLTL